MATTIQRSRALCLWGLGLILFALLLATALDVSLPAGRGAEVRAGICQQLLAGQTAGRQGIVSSVWWPPLPALLTLPLAFVVRYGDCLLATLVLSALFGAGTLILLDRVLAGLGARRWRWLLVAGLGFSPQFLAACWRGSSITLAMFLLVLCAYGLTSWLLQRRLRDLVWFGIGAALLVCTSAELIGWVAGASLLLGAAELRRRAEPREREAVLIVALLPTLYAAGLWVLLSWLIMGDPLYPIRSLSRPGPGPGQSFVVPDRFLWFGIGNVAILLLTMAQALRRRDQAGVGLSLLGLALPGTAGLLAYRDLLWSPEPLLLALAPAVILALGYGLSVAVRLSEAFKWTLAVVPLALGLALGARPGAGEAASQALPLPEVSGAERGVAESEWLPRLERHVRGRTPFVKVFVCGYESFALLRGPASPVFVHALDFNFDKAKHDYYGHSLYVLIHRPEGRSAMDSVHWKYRNIFIQGGRETLYDSDWGEWRLFELVQAPTGMGK